MSGRRSFKKLSEEMDRNPELRRRVEALKRAYEALEAGADGGPHDEAPMVSLPDDPFDDETLPADASANLDRYLYGDGEKLGDGGRG